MMIGRMNYSDPGIGHSEDAVDLVDVVMGLERDMALEEGTLLRQLTAAVDRRRRFEELRRDHDVRYR